MAHSLEKMPTTALVFAASYNFIMVVGGIWALFRLGARLDFDDALAVKPLCAVMVLGTMMGAVHCLASLGAHAGKGDLTKGWLTFYLARPITGAGIALMTTLVLKGGLGGFEVKRAEAVLAWAALAGLYSQAALDKLKELFASLFRTSGTETAQATGATPAPGPAIPPAATSPVASPAAPAPPPAPSTPSGSAVGGASAPALSPASATSATQGG